MRIIGIANTGKEVCVVTLLKKPDGTFTLEDQRTLKLQTGERAEAYGVMFDQFRDLITHSKASCVCFKASALTLGATKLVHLESAEVRGVIIAAASITGVDVRMTHKGSASKTFGERKVDEYLKDDMFWTNLGLRDLKKTMREATFSAINHFKDK